uniref:Uncharacterized protein n=1 Tax=Vespula pensylvanica TaxID=30213 RepID=A0A834P4A7_VESPE|nr:hypothetical protein H0235_007131 [Vespula pensylvanica]
MRTHVEERAMAMMQVSPSGERKRERKKREWLSETEDDENGFPIAVIKVTRIPLPEAWNIRDINLYLIERYKYLFIRIGIKSKIRWCPIIIDEFEHFGKYRDAQCGFREVGQSGLAQLQRRCLFRRIICLVCVTITDSLPDDSNTAGAIVPR